MGQVAGDSLGFAMLKEQVDSIVNPKIIFLFSSHMLCNIITSGIHGYLCSNKGKYTVTHFSF